MKLIKKDYRVSMELELGQQYEFRYQMENGVWENDWEADDYVPYPFVGVYNSVVSVETKPPASAESKGTTNSAIKPA